MFESLSTRLQDVFKSLRGEARLTPENIEAALREIRLALLEADVNFKVVKAFIDRVRDRAMGQDVLRSLSPSQQVVKIVRDEMLALFGDAEGGLQPTQQAAARDPAARPAGRGQDDDRGQAGEVADEAGPASAAGVDRRQASGGDSAAERRRRRRPACGCYDPAGRDGSGRAREGRGAEAGNLGFDVVIVDTAGRLHIDDELMTELVAIKDVTDAVGSCCTSPTR